MRPHTFLAVLALAACPASAAQAGGYGVYSGAGVNPFFEVWTPPAQAFPKPWMDPAPLGTAPNPVLVPGHATMFKVGRRVVYNAPASPRELYRIVPHR